MVFLKNIAKQGNKISCNYSPEESGEIGYVEVDISTREYTRKEKTNYDNDTESYIFKARCKLLDLANASPIPKESRVVWY